METIDGIDLNGFTLGVTIKALRSTGCSNVPTTAGVYVVVRTEMTAPILRPKSQAGLFKGQDPSYPEADVHDSWVDGATVVYIGKARGRNGLRQRVRQLVGFAYGTRVGHRGGRLLWHLADWENLQVRWKESAHSSPDELKAELIGQFQQKHGARPFANRTNK